MKTGYAQVNGLSIYWESRGTGGIPLVVSHGGFGVTTMFGDLLDELAEHRQVIAIELQGHGRTANIARPLDFAALGEDIAALAADLGFDRVDLLGYSFGGSASLRAAIQHPDLVHRLAVVSIPCKRDGWLPDVLQGMSQVNSSIFEMMKQSPLYAAYAAVAPDVDAFPALMDAMGELLQRPYDWSAEVAALTVPTLLVYGDSDSVGPAHAAEFYGLLGGGLRDAGWNGSGASTNRLAILPGLTHYDIFTASALARVVDAFFS